MKKIFFSSVLLISLFSLGTLTAQPVQEWVQRYNGPDNGLDLAFSLTVDYLGDVIVCGSSPAPGQGNDITTIKYNSAGILLWEARYNGPDNLNDGINGTNAVAVDNQGNVYVTGWSESVDGWVDIVTIKYDSTGMEFWAERYTGPGANYDAPMGLKLDASGNVYVAGRSDGPTNGSDYFLMKYNNAGVFQWSQSYDASGHSYDCANAIALDNAGNIYITGYASGSTSGDCITLKYNSDGVQQWEAVYNSANDGGDYGNVIITDDEGNVYVGGGTFSNDSYNDFLVLKYNSSGQQQWVDTYSSSGSNSDEVRSIAMDGSGNVYVTGVLAYSEGGSTDNYGTLKINPAGTVLWDQVYDGPAAGSDEPWSIAVDNDGNSYVVGYSHIVSSAEDLAVVKYNTNGVQQWVETYDGPVNGPDVGYDLVVDNTGNIFATGCSFGENSMDYVVLMYSQIIPVEFKSFSASVNGANVILDWSTATETNNKGFEVQRSRQPAGGEVSLVEFDGHVGVQRPKGGYAVGSKQWEKIGYVAGSGTTTESRSYSFNDNNVSTGNYIYRLKQIDFDGRFKYSPEVEAEIPNPESFSLEQNYPNPFNPSTTIKFNLAKDSRVSLIVYNIIGQEIASLVNGNLAAGQHSITFDASQLTSGIYFYKIKINGNEFASIKKMMLLK